MRPATLAATAESSLSMRPLTLTMFLGVDLPLMKKAQNSIPTARITTTTSISRPGLLELFGFCDIVLFLLPGRYRSEYRGRSRYCSSLPHPDPPLGVPRALGYGYCQPPPRAL